jgi:MFS family permease
VAGFLIVLAPLAARSVHPVLLTMVLFFAQMFIAGGFVVLTLTDGMNAQRKELQGKEQAGFLAGISISSWALVTAVLTPVLGRFFDHKDYVGGFWLVACLPVLGVALWAVLRSSERETVSV